MGHVEESPVRGELMASQNTAPSRDLVAARVVTGLPRPGASGMARKMTRGAGISESDVTLSGAKPVTTWPEHRYADGGAFQ